MGNDGLRIESIISLLGMTDTSLWCNWLVVGLKDTAGRCIYMYISSSRLTLSRFETISLKLLSTQEPAFLHKHHHIIFSIYLGGIFQDSD
jgi:hypothetical protein